MMYGEKSVFGKGIYTRTGLCQTSKTPSTTSPADHHSLARFRSHNCSRKTKYPLPFSLALVTP